LLIVKRQRITKTNQSHVITVSEDNAIPSKGKTSHEADNDAVPIRDGQTPQEIIAEQVDSDQEKMALDEAILVRAAEQAEQTEAESSLKLPCAQKRRQRRGNIVDCLQDSLTAREINLPAKRNRKTKK